MMANHKDPRITIGRLEFFLPPFPARFRMSSMMPMVMAGLLGIGWYFKRFDGDFGWII